MRRAVPSGGRAQGRERLFGLRFGGGQHASQRAVAHDGDHAGTGQAWRLVDVLEPRGRRGWAQHATVEHAGQTKIVDEARSAERLVGQVDPRHPLGSGPGGDRLAAGIASQQRVVGQRPIAGAVAGGSRHLAVTQIEFGGGAIKAARGLGEVDRSHLGRDLPQRRAGVLDGKAARCHALVRAAGSAGRDGADLVRPYAKLLRHDLRQRSEDALAKLHLAGAHLNEPFGPDTQPLVEPAVDIEAPGPAGDGTHRHAAWTARTMRLCAPHRHRLRSSAARISASSGCCCRRSKAAALIRTPDQQ